MDESESKQLETAFLETEKRVIQKIKDQMQKDQADPVLREQMEKDIADSLGLNRKQRRAIKKARAKT